MPFLDALAPIFVICAVAAIHVAYYRRQAGRKTQFVIDVTDHTQCAAADGATTRLNPGSDFEPASRVSGGWVRLSHDGSVSPAAASTFENLSLRIAEQLGRRVFVRGDIRLVEGDFIDVLICMGDVIIDGPCTFLSSIKVAGDLIVNGDARFLKPVVVNRHTKLNGAASFAQGLVSKGQTVVSGHLEIGEPKSEAWVVAQTFTMTGDTVLSGQITAIEGQLPRWAA